MSGTRELIEIDGSHGEGGGQVLRTALSLAAVTQTPIRLDNIRAGRKRPGLLRQHLTCVRAIAEITDAVVANDALGSQQLSLVPGPVRAGEYELAIGTAGSTGLVLQTVLWPLLRADGPSRVILEGGTHNPMSPPFDFLERTFVPLLRTMGARVDLRLERYGFYPVGGGRIVCDIEPCAELAPIDLLDAGPVTHTRARAVVAKLPRHIAERELRVVRKRAGVADGQPIETDNAMSPGNVITIDIERERLTEVVTGFGQKGVPAEDVARDAADHVKRYLDAGAPVGVHLADQLIIPLALAGAGAFRTLPLSDHTRTNIAVVSQFIPASIEVRREHGNAIVHIAEPDGE